MNVQRAALTWGILFVAAFANGALRQFAYAPLMSEQRSNQISCVIGIALFGAVIGVAARKWPFASRGQALQIGMSWVAATVAFEFLFMHYAAGHAWSRLLSEYELWNGRLWTLVLASLAAWPVVWWKVSPTKAHPWRSAS
jgi:hypothetical protein